MDLKEFAVCSLLSGWDAAVHDLCDAEASDRALEPVSGLPSTCQLLGHGGRGLSRQGMASGALGSSGVSLEICGRAGSLFACGGRSIHSPIFLDLSLDLRSSPLTCCRTRTQLDNSGG